MAIVGRSTMLSAVTFDLWQTLICDTPEQEECRKTRRVEEMFALLSSQDFAVGREQLASAHDAVWDRCSELWKQNRDVSAREQTIFFLEAADIEYAAVLDESLLAEAERIYTSGVEWEPPEVMPDAVETLTELGLRGLKLGLICNTGRTPGYRLRVILERYQFLKQLKVLTFSNELKVRKPDVRVFEGTLKKLGVSPAESVHVGDDLATDIRGAKTAGIRAVLLQHDLAAQPLRKPPTFVGYDPAGMLILVPPDATIRSLAELPGILTSLESPHAESEFR